MVVRKQKEKYTKIKISIDFSSLFSSHCCFLLRPLFCVYKSTTKSSLSLLLFFIQFSKLKMIFASELNIIFNDVARYTIASFLLSQPSNGAFKQNFSSFINRKREEIRIREKKYISAPFTTVESNTEKMSSNFISHTFCESSENWT